MEMAKILIGLPKRKKTRPDEKISGLRQFFFFNGNPNGFLNAISMMPKKSYPPQPGNCKILYHPVNRVNPV